MIAVWVLLAWQVGATMKAQEMPVFVLAFEDLVPCSQMAKRMEVANPRIATTCIKLTVKDPEAKENP